MLLVVALVYGAFGGQGAAQLQAGAPMWAVFLLTLALEVPLCVAVACLAPRCAWLRLIFGF